MTDTTGETEVVAVARRGLSRFWIGKFRELEARDSSEGCRDPPLDDDPARGILGGLRVVLACWRGEEGEGLVEGIDDEAREACVSIFKVVDEPA